MPNRFIMSSDSVAKIESTNTIQDCPCRATAPRATTVELHPDAPVSSTRATTRVGGVRQAQKTATNPSVKDAAPPWSEAVGQIFNVIPDLADPPEVQDGLRAILEDPGLEIFWWDWETECYVDIHGEPNPVVADTPERVVTYIGYETRKVGAVI